MKPAYAGQIVRLISASSRVMRSSGNQPPAGQPLASWRVIAEWKPMSGLTCSPGASDGAAGGKGAVGVRIRF